MTMSQRTFGIEIECYGRRTALLLEFIRAKGLDVSDRGPQNAQWVIKSDPTIRPYNDACTIQVDGRRGGARARVRDEYANNLDHSIELVSPILRGEDGIAQVEKVCEVLKRLDYRVNTSCGLHVHIGAEDLNPPQLYTILKRYADNEDQIDRFMDHGRRGNVGTFCRSAISACARITQNIESARGAPAAVTRYCDCGCGDTFTEGAQQNPLESVDNFIAASAYGGRYNKVNTTTLRTHGTLEFRQHHGSVDSDEITSWVRFLVNHVETSLLLTERPASDSRPALPSLIADQGIYMGLDLASVQQLGARPGAIINNRTIGPQVAG